MTPRRPRDVGTAAETEVARAFHRAGLPAHRNALAGAADRGDVHALDGRIVTEVKAGAMTKRVSWPQLAAWLAETEREASRVTRCDLGLLVVKRWGSARAEDWPAWTWLDDLTSLLDPGATSVLPHVPISVRLGDLLDQLTSIEVQR